MPSHWVHQQWLLGTALSLFTSLLNLKKKPECFALFTHTGIHFNIKQSNLNIWTTSPSRFNVKLLQGTCVASEKKNSLPSYLMRTLEGRRCLFSSYQRLAPATTKAGQRRALMRTAPTNTARGGGQKRGEKTRQEDRSRSIRSMKPTYSDSTKRQRGRLS